MRKGLAFLLLVVGFCLTAKEHPNLILTKSGVASMRSALGVTPLFDSSFEQAKAKIDAEIAQGIDVPLPKDLAGGYTHEKHKANFFNMQKAGVLFQVTQDEKYAIYIRDMLLQYAEVFPTFEKHPAERSYARGKFFWQCLNDANWLVYTSQAYDNIYDWLDKKTVEKLNKELFRPYAEYISIQNPQFFNRIHNHSTWGNAAVGMIGLVMDDEELIKWSLYGLSTKVPSDIVTDNDGGSIRLKDQEEAGFFAQLDHSFSPEGYYTEGPYYQRYAIYPFLIFAQALANEMPELNILEYREDLLIKAVYALIDQTNGNGEFFPFNDAQKGMSLSSRELVTAISMAYFYGKKDAHLLSLIEEQARVPLNPSGISAAKAIAEGRSEKYKKTSKLLFDGENGDEGAISILRSTDDSDLTLVMKYAKHGMGHGHFDRLSFMLYDGGEEVFQDYGSARWVNIKHKDGGGYLKENKTWAKQTVAHNSLVINQTTQFKGKVKVADETHGDHYLFDTSNPDVQVIGAKENQAYPGWQLSRTMAMINLEELEKPVVLDLMSVSPKGETYADASFELPLYYVGELMSTNLDVKHETTLTPMGEKHGYQHLWKEANAPSAENKNFKMTWFNGLNFYSLISSMELGDSVLFTRIGANDPKFNLRRDPGILIKRKGGANLFAQAYEAHGNYNASSEIPINSFSSLEALNVLYQSRDYNVVRLSIKDGGTYTFCISLKDAKKEAVHELEINGSKMKWTGPYYLLKN